MIGAVQTVLTCGPSAETVAPCPSGTAPVVTTAYLLDVSAQQQVDAAFSPIDYGSAVSFSLLAFCSIIALWASTLIFRTPIRALNRK